ncbi:MAG TPA: glycosyltransferase, partial [Candidatus Sulfotelmatobacter sp.]|nr:glycosyltransferase [Candidatus Sulfotelmatobacter sp.]
MPLTPTLLAAVPFAIWLYLLFARGNFWQVNEDASEAKPPKRWPRVVVIVPARDEARTISRSVTSLAKQDYPGESSVVVVDDHSSD